MIMAAVRRDSEIDRHFVEEGRIGQRDALPTEIIGHGEAERVAPRRERALRQIGAAAVGVGRAPRDLAVRPAERHRRCPRRAGRAWCRARGC